MGSGWRLYGIGIEAHSEYVSSAAGAVDGGGVRGVYGVGGADVLDDGGGRGVGSGGGGVAVDSADLVADDEGAGA